MEQKDYDFSRQLVDHIVDDVDVQYIQHEIENKTVDYKSGKPKDYNSFLTHTNALFLNVVLNELNFRSSKAEARALEARRVVRKLIDELRLVW
jgi:hypothetical protein